MRTTMSLLLISSTLAASLLAACAELDGTSPATSDDGSSELDAAESALTTAALAAAVDRTARIVSGALQVRSELPSAGPWHTIATNVAGVRLAGDRIVIRKNDSSVWAKEGDITAGVFTQLAPAGAALEIAAAGRLIAVRSSAGKIELKNGALTAPWSTLVASGARKVAVSGCGAAGGSTAAQAEAACAAAARIGYVDASNVLRVRTPQGAWTQIATDVAEVQLVGGDTAVRTTTGTVRYNNGFGWVDVATGITGMALGIHGIGLTKSTPSVGSLYAVPLNRVGQAPVNLGLGNVSALTMGASYTNGRFAIRLASGAMFTNNSVERQWQTPWTSEGTGIMIMLSRACHTEDLAGEGFTTVCF